MKYVIELEDKPIAGTQLYKAIGFNALVFDQHGINHMKPFKVESAKEWQKGYDCGHEDGYKQGQSDGFTDAYEAGQWAAWNTILAIGGHANDEIKRIFELGDVADPIFAVVKKYTPNEAMGIIKAYEDKPKQKTNAEMFRDVFPEVDTIDKLVKIIKNASDRHCMMRSEWWDEPYEKSEDDDG